MTALIGLGGLLVAGVGQWFKAHPKVPTVVVQLVLIGIGLGVYAVADAPKAWSGQPLLDWLDKAWLWAFALPGLASTVGSVTPLKTTN